VFPEEGFFVLCGKLSVIGVLVVICCLAGFGCGGDPVRPVIPTGPSQPFPADNAADVSQISVFGWSYNDTSQLTTYSLYLATSAPPTLIDSLLIDTLYDPGPLRVGTKYYWKIVAHNASGRVISSPIWSFTTSSDFVFPLAIGNSWSYSRKFYSHICEPDSLPDPYKDTVFGTSTTLVQSFDTLLDSVEAYHLHTVWSDDFGGSEYNNYRNNTQDGLYEYAYGPRGGVWPPRVTSSNGTFLEFMGMRFRDLRELRDVLYSNMNGAIAGRLDSIRYEDPPIQLLAYPLQIGQRWIYRGQVEGTDFHIEKEVLSLENILSPAGEFECFKIRWFWDIDNDGQWDNDIDGYDYVSPVGVIRREFLFYDVIIGEYSGLPFDTCDFVDEYELTDYHLERD
jgi:hypothetical protein